MGKGTLLKRLRSVLIIVILLIFVVGPVCLYALLRLGWPPVIGNLSAAGKLRAYAAQVYPDAEAGSCWAGYNLVDGCYYLDFQNRAGGSRTLRYDTDGRLVRDERREEALRRDLEIDKAMRMNGFEKGGAYWWARWDCRDPETPLVTLRTDFWDKAGDTVPDEETMREIMADRAMELYAALSPVTPVDKVSVHYSHDAMEEAKDGGTQWYWITVELPEDTPLAREMVLSGKLESR